MKKATRRDIIIARTVSNSSVLLAVLYGTIGIGVFLVTLWMQWNRIPFYRLYFSDAAESLQDPILLLMGTAVVTVLFAVIHVAGSLQRSSKWLAAAILVGLIIVAGCLAVGVIVYERCGEYCTNAERDKVGKTAMRMYRRLQADDKTYCGSYKMDVIQEQLQCCGINNWTDWLDPRFLNRAPSSMWLPEVPESCCACEGCSRAVLRTHLADMWNSSMYMWATSMWNSSMAATNASANAYAKVEAQVFTLGCGAKFSRDYHYAVLSVYSMSGVLGGLVLLVMLLALYLAYVTLIHKIPF